MFARAPGLPLCRYGNACYRKNPKHWTEFDHDATHPFLVASPPAAPPAAPPIDGHGPEPPSKKQRVSAAAADDGTDVDEDPEQVADEDTEEDEAPSNSAAMPDATDTLGPLADGETISIQGSSAEPYKVKRTGAVYSCSCPAWRNQGGGNVMRTCKHIKGLRGEDAERARLGGDAKAFYATGNKVMGAPSAAASSGGGATNEAVAKGVALAASWDDKKDVRGWLLSEKLDGQRCVWDGKGTCWTRTGHEVYAPSFFVDALPKGTPLDGELWMGRGNFQSVMSVCRRQDKPEAEWRKVTFVVFDAPDAAGGIGARLEAARAALGGAPPAVARMLEHEVVQDAAHVRRRLREVEEAGGEGLCLRHPTAAHRGGRSHELLKVKSARDDEALVTGHEGGKGKHAGRLGALRCKLRSGKAFKVGTGFSDAEREAPPPVGSVITFRYFELTNDEVPRFPAYLRVRPDVDAAAFC